MHVVFGVAANKQRWAWTDGLAALDQRELAAPLGWSEGDLRDRGITQLLRFIEGYVTRQPKRILPRQTMRYGWSALRFREGTESDGADAASRLVIQELAEPMTSTEPAYIDGAGQAVALLAEQVDAIRRNRVTGECEHPGRMDSAVICNKVDPHGGSSICIQRMPPAAGETPDPSDSRWFIGCTDDAHNHNDLDNLQHIHLLHIVEHYPHVFEYLPFPDGTAVSFENNEAVVFLPNDAEGRFDKILNMEVDRKQREQLAKPFLGLRPHRA